VSSARRFNLPAIPDPTTDPHSLRNTAMATKELVETLAGFRGKATDVAVTWGDLVRLGLIAVDRIPKDIGQDSFRRP
jgi:hypothetical protein